MKYKSCSNFCRVNLFRKKRFLKFPGFRPLPVGDGHKCLVLNRNFNNLPDNWLGPVVWEVNCPEWGFRKNQRLIRVCLFVLLHASLFVCCITCSNVLAMVRPGAPRALFMVPRYFQGLPWNSREIKRCSVIVFILES